MLACIQTDNRGSAHRGVAFELPIRHHMGSIEIEDQVDGVTYLISMGLTAPDVGVGMFGWSYGGYMTLMSMCLRGDVFRVGVSGAPVSDWDGYVTC